MKDGIKDSLQIRQINTFLQKFDGKLFFPLVNVFFFFPYFNFLIHAKDF